MAVNDSPGAEQFLPPKRGVRALRSAAQQCRGCDLYIDATQAVFGEGPLRSRLMLIGEQPGDNEDRTGRPFTGPAGRLLDRCLDVAGIDRSEVFLTNAVKHFRFRTRGATGKRRIHQTPTQRQLVACQPWLEAELDAVRPEGAVVLGAVAGKAIFGSGFRVGEHRREIMNMPGRHVWALPTIHPSAALRSDQKDELIDGFIEDLRLAASHLTSR